MRDSGLSPSRSIIDPLCVNAGCAGMGWVAANYAMCSGWDKVEYAVALGSLRLGLGLGYQCSKEA